MCGYIEGISYIDDGHIEREIYALAARPPLGVGHVPLLPLFILYFRIFLLLLLPPLPLSLQLYFFLAQFAIYSIFNYLNGFHFAPTFLICISPARLTPRPGPGHASKCHSAAAQKLK